MKITETEKGNIKIVMNREHVKALHNLLEKMPVWEIEKYIDEEGVCDVCDIWHALEEVYNPQ